MGAGAGARSGTTPEVDAMAPAQGTERMSCTKRPALHGLGHSVCVSKAQGAGCQGYDGQHALALPCLRMTGKRFRKGTQKTTRLLDILTASMLH
jgi:hypothetical protein